jgi:hypothetical protein
MWPRRQLTLATGLCRHGGDHIFTSYGPSYMTAQVRVKKNLLAFSLALKYYRSMKKKNPAAVALGRLGGLKGGKARAAALSAERRTDIARKAVMARWAKRRKVK